MKPARRAFMTWLALAVAACGGGAGGVGEGGTGSFASGPISGFGSVIVNGIRFDDAGARIFDERGRERRRDDLRLGQMTEIESGAITQDAAGARSAVASTIRFGSVLIGGVDSVDAAGTLVVSGHGVRSDARTVFDDALTGGVGALAEGDVVEIYGFFDAATSGFVATRVDRPADAPRRFKVRGIVGSVDAAARTFGIGSQRYRVEAGAALPARGDLLRVEVRTEPDGSGVWIVDTLRDAAPALPDLDEAEITGLITRFSSLASFEVDGVPVSTDAGTAFADGSAGLKVGARVEVEGAISGGVLRAEKVELEDDDDDDEGGGFEVSGRITSVDTASRRFVLRGVTVEHDADTRFDDGDAGDLAAGREVEVKGELSADGTRLHAQEIEFDDD